LAFGPRQLWRATGLILALWTLAVAASVVWNVRLLHDAMLDAAERDALNSFNRDVLYLMNPDNMTREMHELKAREDGTLGHITSLKPVRPENAPDAWEAAALRAFEQGRTEVSSRELHQGQPHLRFMKPLIMEAGCLKCHAAQGYHKGDIRGGISVAVPLDPYLALAQARIGHIAGIHAGLWALGVLGIFLGARQMRQRLDKQLQAEAERDQLIQDLQNALANVKSLSGLLPICANCKKIRDDKGYWSLVESYIQEHSEATFTHGLCPDCVKKFYPDLGGKDGSGNSPKKVS
jgi:hypothetical protein